MADYRRRYAQYRTDPDLQRLHAVHPFIATLDDHEFADGAWRDGATEHRAERDGNWAERRAAAFRARWEWLPARQPDPADPERVFRTVPLGHLADIVLLDTRTRRDKPVPPPDMYEQARSALGPQQRDWLLAELSSSTARWRLVVNPSVIARTWNDDLPESVKHALAKVKLIDLDRSGPDWDQWDGYPAEREMLLRFLRERQIGNVVILSGDVHVAMVNELREDELTGQPVAIELVNTSLTSQNLDEKMGWEPQTGSVEVHHAFCTRMPHVRWCDFDSHGYTVVDVTLKRVAADWWAVDTILRPSRGESLVASWTVPSGKASVIPAAEFEVRQSTPQ